MLAWRSRSWRFGASLALVLGSAELNPGSAFAGNVTACRALNICYCINADIGRCVN